MTESLLIDCPACGNRVSREAVACPRCGHPIAERQTGSAEPAPPVSEPRIVERPWLSAEPASVAEPAVVSAPTPVAEPAPVAAPTPVPASGEFARLFSAQGRVGRKRFWAVFFTGLGVNLLFGLFSSSPGAEGVAVAWFLWLIVWGWAWIATSIKRLHDLDKSGSLLLLVFIPVANAIMLVWLGSARGVAEANQYGPVPDDGESRTPVQTGEGERQSAQPVPSPAPLPAWAPSEPGTDDGERRSPLAPAEWELQQSTHDVSPPPLLPAWAWAVIVVLVVGVVAAVATQERVTEAGPLTTVREAPAVPSLGGYPRQYPSLAACQAELSSNPGECVEVATNRWVIEPPGDQDGGVAQTTTTTEPVAIESQGMTNPPALTEKGIGLAQFGKDADYALRLLKQYLGEPSQDSGWREPDWLRCYLVDAERVVSWNRRGFLAVFASGGERFGGSGERFVRYYVQADPAILQDEILMTDLGLKPGDHYRDLREAYGDVEIIDYPFSENGYVELATGYGQGLNAWLDADNEIEAITAGSMCGE